MRIVSSLIVLVAFAGLACKSGKAPENAPGSANKAAAVFAVMSSAFSDGAALPKKFTCDGQDQSPPLAWTGVPAAAKSLALICDDPDAPVGTWTHWVLWGMAPSTPSLPEGVPKDATLPGGIKQGQNSWPKTGYNGPCPPPGKPHRYIFTLFALDIEPDLPPNAAKPALVSAMQGHILAQAQLTGMYGR